MIKSKEEWSLKIKKKSLRSQLSKKLKCDDRHMYVRICIRKKEICSKI